MTSTQRAEPYEDDNKAASGQEARKSAEVRGGYEIVEGNYRDCLRFTAVEVEHEGSHYP